MYLLVDVFRKHGFRSLKFEVVSLQAKHGCVRKKTQEAQFDELGSSGILSKGLLRLYQRRILRFNQRVEGLAALEMSIPAYLPNGWFCRSAARSRRGFPGSGAASAARTRDGCLRPYGGREALYRRDRPRCGSRAPSRWKSRIPLVKRSDTILSQVAYALAKGNVPMLRRDAASLPRHNSFPP